MPLLLLAGGVAALIVIMLKKNTMPGPGMDLPRADRIRLHRNFARIIAAKNGIAAFADWAVGQAGAESDYGNSNVFAMTNNPFGIKAGSWIKGVDAAGNPIMARDGLRVARVAGHDGPIFYRAFPTLEAAYQHLFELYHDMVPKYRESFPLLAAGQYAAFAAAIGPIYEPARPATGPGSYSELVLGCIKAAQAVT